MSGIEKLVEWVTQAKKREAQDEAMDKAQEKIETALAELSESNEHLGRALKSTQIIVSQRNDP